MREAITRNQHAYISSSSTESALHAVVSRLEQGIAEGRFTLAIFLDIQEAFKYVSYEALTSVETLCKLFSYFIQINL